MYGVYTPRSKGYLRRLNAPVAARIYTKGARARKTNVSVTSRVRRSVICVIYTGERSDRRDSCTAKLCCDCYRSSGRQPRVEGKVDNRLCISRDRPNGAARARRDSRSERATTATNDAGISRYRDPSTRDFPSGAQVHPSEPLSRERLSLTLRTRALRTSLKHPILLAAEINRTLADARMAVISQRWRGYTRDTSLAQREMTMYHASVSLRKNLAWTTLASG